MMSLPAIAASGMHAAQAALSASAHNLANLSTPGFHLQQVAQSAVPGGGVSASLATAPQAGVSMEADLVDMLAAKNQFLANLAVFRTGQQMTGSLLDVAG